MARRMNCKTFVHVQYKQVISASIINSVKSIYTVFLGLYSVTNLELK
jgi:hypothetical protein